MPTQTATTGNLDEAQNIIIAQCRYTAEHNQPCVNLIEHFRLGKGEKQITAPKVGQMEAQDLVDGIDLVTSKDIGMTTTDLTCSEVGLKVILTDKLVRQENEDMFKVVGRQMGDAMARKKDKDVITLFSGFSNTGGAATKSMSFANWSACAAIMKNLKAPRPISCVQHPYAVYTLMNNVAKVATYPIPTGLSEDLLKDFWAMTFDGIGVFHDGNIVPDGEDDAIGAFFSQSALCFIESLAPNVEREKDISLRATELVMVSDYGCFELDDGYGLKITYDAAAPSTIA